jgi:hypothetical protein
MNKHAKRYAQTAAARSGGRIAVMWDHRWIYVYDMAGGQKRLLRARKNGDYAALLYERLNKALKERGFDPLPHRIW